jgi:hypothetical protein
MVRGLGERPAGEKRLTVTVVRWSCDVRGLAEEMIVIDYIMRQVELWHDGPGEPLRVSSLLEREFDFASSIGFRSFRLSVNRDIRQPEDTRDISKFRFKIAKPFQKRKFADSEVLL